MKVAIFGLGYVGLVTGASLGDAGHQVIGYDTDSQKLQSLLNSEVPFFEPGLAELVTKNINHGSLLFSNNIEKTVADSDVVFIAVGTPPSEDGSADLTSLNQVVESLGKIFDRPVTVVIKSTVPVGTNQAVDHLLHELLGSRGLQFRCDVVSNPEFLREGNALQDVFNPDRIVVGASSRDAFDRMRELYAPFHFNCPVLEMEPASAELSKYAANTFLASRISFMNELSRLAEAVGADIEQVSAALGADARIGSHFLRAGLGYGGSCFPKDILSLQHMFREQGIEPALTDAIQRVNSEQRNLVVSKVIQHFGDAIDLSTVALWGLTFKPDTDDMRDAPSLEVAGLLLKAGANLRLYDPVLNAAIRERFPSGSKLQFVEDMYEVARGSDAIFLVTEWREFSQPDFLKLKQWMRTPIIFDGRNLWDPKVVRSQGFTYYGVGRP
ncbi:MAG: UDP-glucose dehydrogenase family protein [Ferrimicrobium sp.]